jgi:NADPH:quinone reductase-like Zn-dependent oxidoreductase
MRAVVHDRYGPPEVLRVDEVEQPVPKDDEVLVRVHATTVNRTDCHIRAADPFLWRLLGAGLLRPKQRILGRELAGEVEAIGAAVTEFALGDRVFGGRSGANAEFVCVREAGLLAHIPAGISFEEAAAVPDGALGALTCLKRMDLREGKRILVYGASGSIGTAGVQLVKHFGADVTAVCNTKNLELVRSLGADRVIDYTQEDFTKNGETYDVVFDAVGKHSFRRSRGSLEPGGLYITTDGLHNIVLSLVTGRIGGKKVLLPISPRPTTRDVRFLKELIEAGEYRAVIDRTYPMEDVIEATRYVETRQKTGNVVLTVDGDRAQSGRSKTNADGRS